MAAEERRSIGKLKTMSIYKIIKTDKTHMTVSWKLFTIEKRRCFCHSDYDFEILVEHQRLHGKAER